MKNNTLKWVQELFVIEIYPSCNGEHILQIKEPGKEEKSVSRGIGPDQPYKVSMSKGQKGPEVWYCSPNKIKELIGVPLDSIIEGKSKCKCKDSPDPIFVDHQDSGFKEIRCSRCGGHINTKGKKD